MGLSLLSDEEGHKLSDGWQETLDMLTEACSSMKTIMNDNLDYSKI